MTDSLPLPSCTIATVRRAHAETERGLQFSALVDRLAAREATRDPHTGLTPDDVETEWTYRSRSRLAYHRRVESPHNPLLS